MSVKVSWYDEENTIIVQEFPEIWTWDEFYDAVKRTVELENQVSHPLYVIGTQPRNGQTPKGNVISQYNVAIRMHEDHMRYYLIATDNYLTTIFGNIFLKTTAMRDKVRMVNKFGDALNFIAQDKKKLEQAASA
ncbi:MAG: hypothetical protein L0154_27105 [Chloroflexi bacterium]|nr:hypothetical protein [Chloroflexota bacterium]